MKVLCTGRQIEVTPAIRAQIEEKLNKLHRILGSRLELEAHFILAREHHGLLSAEVTLNARHHSLIAVAANHNALSAVQEVLEKLEKQAIRNRTRWREIRRQPKVPIEAVLVAAAAAAGQAAYPAPIPPGREDAVRDQSTGASLG